MKVLLCSPNHFQVTYVINPWMKPGTVDTKKAQTQWNTVKDTYTSLGVHVDVIAQEETLPDMVFAVDQGIVVGNHVLLSNFQYNERKGETTLYRQWFEDHGYTTEQIMTTCFEGGDILPFGETYFLGSGFRACVEIVPFLASTLNATLYPLELVDSRFYHLDTCLFIVDTKTAFYYPPAFSQVSVRLLQRTIPKLFEFTHEEARMFAANSVHIGNTVVIQKGLSRFRQLLTALGKTVVEVDVSEFNKSGGGIHCLTLTLAS